MTLKLASVLMALERLEGIETWPLLSREENAFDTAFPSSLSLSKDMASLKNWWKNRFLRILLCFILPGFGSMIGTWVGGVKIISSISGILKNLLHSLF